MKKYLLFAVLIMTNAFASQHCDLVFSTGKVLHKVPIAITAEQQAQGLSKRSKVGPGMLFVWMSAAPRFFWMHDTWVPLSIGYFDANGKLFSIESMVENTETIHPSHQPALLALELPQGGFAANHLQVGDRLLHFCKAR